MDLGDIDLEKAAGDGIVVTIMHPGTGEQLKGADDEPITITVLGRDSTEWQKTSHKVGKKLQAKYKKKVPPEAIEDSLREVLSYCVLDWTNVVFEGEELECTQENAFQLFEDRQWIAEQILEKAVDRASYFLG